MSINDAEKHSALSLEAHRRIACATAMDESVSTRADGDAAVILAGARACLWLMAGTSRAASERLSADLTSEHGVENVLAAAIALCFEQPPGARAWLKKTCALRARKSIPARRHS